MMHSIFDTPSDVRSFSSSNYHKKPVIVLVYMHGCPYCEMMKQEWNSFKNSDVISTIDVNHELLNTLIEKDRSLFKPVSSFPTIYAKNVLYDGDRTKDSFIEFSKDIKKMDAEEKKKTAPNKKDTTEEKKKADPKKSMKKKDTNK